MHLSIVIGLVLVAVQLGFLDGCSHSHDDHHVRTFRHKLLHGMRMSEGKIRAIKDEIIDEVKQHLPMIDVHQPEKHETRFVIEKDVEDLLSDEHLFNLPDSISERDLLNVFLNFHVRPVLDADSKVTIDVKARESGSETFSYLGSQEFAAFQEVKHLRMKLDEELMKKWFNAPTKSIVIVIECRDTESNLIINKGADDADGKRVILEFDLATRSKRKRRDTATKCTKGEQGQECCIMSKEVRLRDIGLKNVFSPESATVSWCAGACKKESSFTPLFAGFTSKIHANATEGACCHGTSSSHIDILYIDENSAVMNQRIYDVAFTECRCA